MRVNYLIAIIACIGFSSFHPLHVSFTNLDFDQERQEWRLSAKLFSDDFQDILRKKYGPGILGDKKEISLDQSSFLIKYFAEHLDIRINGKSIPVKTWRLDKVSTNFEATWIEFTFDFSESPHEFSIRNTILFDSFSDQKNLLFVAWNEKEKAFQFTRKRRFFTFRI
ncbi:MAG: hypothetical protein HN352_16135 [Bacteroidetes bacterium]|jgi:hypothetical protein|nr:hypothetical protein [Bacteroidota bacterium]MBT4411005.1 hypothetical protein [Bacteroidota bacterium]MBT5427904.1 hypothetical protein [Bacteroidota bacterium]